MIDRGALVVCALPSTRYSGVYRTPLDAAPFTGRKGKDLARRYTAAIVAGEGVLEDLDEALSMRDEARAMGLEGIDVLVFVVPQTPWNPRALEVLEAPPADDLEALGWDVIELMEPWHSPLRAECDAHNGHGLYATRAEAEARASALNTAAPGDEPYVAVRVWRAT